MELKKKLSPPQISGILPAFTIGGEQSSTISIPFILNYSVGAKDFDRIAIIIKTVSTGIEKLRTTTTNFQFDDVKRCYIAYFPCFEDAQIGQYYKVQIACQLGEDDNGVGYYSSVGVIKCTSQPKVFIKDRENTKSNTYEYVGVYSQEDGDPTEKVSNYKFDLYDNSNNLISTSGILLHNSSNDEIASSIDTWTIRQALKPNLSYFIQYTVYTNNGLKCSSTKYEVMEVQFEDPVIHADLSAKNIFDNGCINVSLIGKKDNSYISGRFILLRASSEDNYDSWYELTRFQLNRWDSNTTLLICKDYTVQQGVEYLYAIQAYNSAGTYSNRLQNIEEKVFCDFEDAFLYDDQHQLKIRFNPKVNNFKSTILESKIDTLGGRYPFIFRNGNVKYKEFAISGLLSCLSESVDDNNSQGWQLIADNYKKERDFKLATLEWLNNGKPKLFKSGAEGNYIVRLMNVSLMPNDTLGRMLHTFNCSAYEIADYNFENLQAFGFTTPAYTETRTLKFDQWHYNQQESEIIDLNKACMCEIINEGNTSLKIDTYFTDNTHISFIVEPYRTYKFDEEILKNNLILKLNIQGEGLATINWAYYDTILDSFSYIYKITSTDKVIQLIGTTGINFIEQMEDIRTRTGAFHYIKLSPRDSKKIYKREDGNYYFNHSDINPASFLKNYIYLIVNEDETITHYVDGRYGVENIKSIDDLSYQVKINGSSIINMDLLNTPLTSTSFKALTNITSLTELFLGDGVIADIVYQENILLYTVEAKESPYCDMTISPLKTQWEEKQKIYQDELISNPPAEKEKEEMNNAYNNYIVALTNSLNKLKEEYDVEFAI